MDNPLNICEWFAYCTNTADGTVRHPALGDVPCCRRCADRCGQTLIRTEH